MQKFRAGLQLRGIVVRYGMPVVNLVQYHEPELVQVYAVGRKKPASLVVTMPDYTEHKVLYGDGHPAGLYSFFAGVTENSVDYIKFSHKSLQFEGPKIIIIWTSLLLGVTKF